MLLSDLSAYASTAALAIALAACGADQTSEEPRTAVTQAQMEEGLVALGFARAELFAGAEPEMDDGVAVYTGLASADAEDPGRIGRLSIAAPRVENGVARFDWIEAEDIVAGGEDGETVSRIARLRAAQPGAALSQLISDIINGRADAEDYQAPSRRAADYTFGELSMSGLSFTEAQEEGAASGGIARLALEAFDGQQLGRAVMEGLSITDVDEAGGEILLRLDEVSITGLDALFVDVALNIEDGGEAGVGAMGAQLAEAMTRWMRPTGAFESFAVRGMDVRAAGARIDMPELAMRYEDQRDGSVDIIAEMPRLTVALSDENPQTAQAGQMLASIGYETLDFSLYSRTRYDPATDRATTGLEDYWFEMRDGLRISLAQDISGLQAYADATGAVMTEIFAELAENPEAAEDLQASESLEAELLEAYGLLQIHSMTIRIDDLDLLERAMTLNAQMQGVSPQEARMQAATMLGLGIAMGGAMLPEGLAIELGAALSAFINQGGAVEITLSPAAPVGMDRLMNVAEDMSVLRELGLSVRHIPAE